jgi:hypothetical protein
VHHVLGEDGGVGFVQQIEEGPGVVFEPRRRQLEQLDAAFAHVREAVVVGTLGDHLEHHAGKVVHDALEHRAPLGELQLCARRGAPRGSRAQLALDRRYEAGEPAFHHVIVGPGAHRFDREVLAHVARDDDERHVVSAAANECQGGHRAETGHVVIGEYDVPPAFPERGGHAFGVFDPAYERLVCRGELETHEIGVGVGIFREQHAQASFHGARV